MRGAEHKRALCWLALALLLSACGARNAPASSAVPGQATLQYHVTLADDLSQLEVELCFSGLSAHTLIPGRNEAGKRLRWARWLSPGARRRLPISAGRILIPKERAQGCIGYAVELSEGGSFSALVARVGPHLLASPSAWLWRPTKRARDVQSTLTLTLPKTLHASLPWPKQSDHYQLDESAFVFDSHAAFGPFRELVVNTQGIEARAALLDALEKQPNHALEAWLAEAAFIATQSAGSFPVRGLQLIVAAQPFGNEAFGSVARGGGASVLLFVPKQQDAAQLRRDWVLPHELSHLLIPFVAREDAWLAEGLATYYQELLRARAGILTADEALANLATNLRAAAHEGTGRTLCEESRAMHQTSAYRSVYWGGAGHWLNVDVALRKQHAPTLDQLLHRLREQARLTPPYSAHELLQKLDQLSGTTLFSALEQHCEQARFPDFEGSLRALGYGRDTLIHDDPAADQLRNTLFAAQRE